MLGKDWIWDINKSINIMEGFENFKKAKPYTLNSQYFLLKIFTSRIPKYAQRKIIISKSDVTLTNGTDVVTVSRLKTVKYSSLIRILKEHFTSHFLKTNRIWIREMNKCQEN